MREFTGLLDGLPTFLPGTLPRQINLQKLLRLHSTCLTALRSQVAVTSSLCYQLVLIRLSFSACLPTHFRCASLSLLCFVVRSCRLTQLNIELQQQLAAIPGLAFSDDELYVLSRQLEPVPAAPA